MAALCLEALWRLHTCTTIDVRAGRTIRRARRYVEYVLVKSVERQYAAFLEGLMMLCKGPAITLFSPVEMERLVCGNPHLDFNSLRGAAKYEAGYTTSTPVVVWLWDIACNEFELPEQRMFLKFFTGAAPARARRGAHARLLHAAEWLCRCVMRQRVHACRATCAVCALRFRPDTCKDRCRTPAAR
jgi:HECT-domain (ubiquitin-transferase)